MEEVQWNNRFNIGVEDLDHAHQRLFAIMRRLMELNKDDAKKKYACQEGIKYFKSYAIKHFASEERYMQYTKYSGYAMHKRLHDNLRDKTLPALEREMEESEYSDESIQHFLGICIGWLTGHIMIEDRAITGRNAVKWVHDETETGIMALEDIIIQFMKEVFFMKTQIVSEHYGGEDIGDAVYYRLTYFSDAGKRYQTFMICEKRLLLRIFGDILGLKSNIVNHTVLEAAGQLAQQLMEVIGKNFLLEEKFRLEKANWLTKEQLTRAFEKEFPNYSLLFDVEGNGYFAFCLRK